MSFQKRVSVKVIIFIAVVEGQNDSFLRKAFLASQEFY